MTYSIANTAALIAQLDLPFEDFIFSIASKAVLPYKI